MNGQQSSGNHWHAVDVKEVLRRLDVSEEGLTGDEAKRRLEEVGPNSLEVEEGVSPLRLLFRQVHNPLIYLLTGAAVLSLFVDHEVDAAVIAGVIVLNTLLGFIQEWRAEGALAALRRMASPHARVLRDGKPLDIDAAEVVPGDILILETGDRVAAGARILLSEDVQVDESALTGESVPTAKNADTLAKDTAMADQKNMVRMSTSVTGGRGRAVVVATGMKTEIGRIAAQVRATSREDTPLQKRMHKLGIVLGVAGVAFAAGVFGLGMLRGYEFIEMFMFSVAVAVSAIPEGLPAVISVTLALGVRRMAERNAIIRRMPAVETLGSITVICSDKTGTITKNQMTTLTAFQWFQAFNARSSTQSIFSIGLFSNRWVLLGVGVAILLQIGAVHSPIGQMLFGTTGLVLGDWLLIVLVSSSIWIADELLKRLGVYGKSPY